MGEEYDWSVTQMEIIVLKSKTIVSVRLWPKIEIKTRLTHQNLP